MSSLSFVLIDPMIAPGVTGEIFPVEGDKLFKDYLSEFMGNADRLSAMGTVCQT